MATAKKTPAAPAKRTRTPREKPTDGSYALKLRVEGVRDEHRAALAAKLGEKPRKITRAALKDWLLEQAQSALNTLYVSGPAAHNKQPAGNEFDSDDDDLLG